MVITYYIESLNHRIIEWTVLKRTTIIISFQPSCYVQGSQPRDQAAQSHIQPGLDISFPIKWPCFYFSGVWPAQAKKKTPILIKSFASVRPADFHPELFKVEKLQLRSIFQSIQNYKRSSRNNMPKALLSESGSYCPWRPIQENHFTISLGGQPFSSKMSPSTHIFSFS